MATKHVPSLDGLRAMSILPVLWHHSTPRPLEGILGRGPLGVDLFFAISGFLITTLLVREQRTHGQVSLKNFYVRRGLRIFPLHYAVLGLYVLRALFFMPDSPARSHFLHNLPWFATYTSNWFVNFNVPHPVVFAFAWSLATEEQFYMVWPGVVALTRGWQLPVAFMTSLLALDQLAEHGLLVSILPWESLATRMLTSIATPICLGSLLAYALDRPRPFKLLALVLGHRGSAPAALAILLALIAVDNAPLLAIHAAMTALVGAVSLRPDHGLRWLTDLRPVRYLGVISYGIYLLHVSSITATKMLLPEPWKTAPLIFLIASLATVAIAAVVHRFFEQPFLALRGKFR